MVEYKLYLAQDDMVAGDKLFLTVNGSGYPATCAVGGSAITERQAAKMIEEGRTCYVFAGSSVQRGEAVLVNPFCGDRLEVIACLQ